ncbi:pectate lyase-like protein [Halanaerobium saccharolyticum]|uniref:Pectate lyase-like protein n=1 Tax=Halanaerobium saccharolyticum TaxID=43595 RepID=A0A4V3G4S3_9FIRM|nr:pectinesterase family protein [Halanaerobium saccharolyticum]RAK06889.1 pectate lyase-like protein [Halanaerobium saccharolyticum]TDW01499.1 pectate lyase-like protein [Halanaerobium saccharolyticum]TDX52860.1 pectate lyase-like protein [Halanaerobium saccharolyticum]
MDKETNKVSEIIEVSEIKEVEFKNQNFNILDYGAKKGGRIKNTEAINEAISACSSSGGGRVIVPSGLYLTGPINFAKNVNLHLEKGAIIKFSSQLENYKIVESEFEGEKNYRFQSPISANGLKNIAITGRGIIDGSGDQWRPVKKYKTTERQWQKLISSGGTVEETAECKIWWPSQKAAQGQELVHNLYKKREAGGKILPEAYREAGEYLRPVLLNFKKCKNILLEGVTFQNSPGWNLHPIMSENIILRQLTIRNPWYAQNGDGLDLDSCQNVLVEECDFDVGDDAICLKSGKNETGRMRNMPTENVFIRNCKVYHGHGGFVIGSEMSSGIKNIYVENCDFMGTDIGIRFKSTRGRGGIVENIYLSQIKMTKIKNEAVKFNLFYESNKKETEPKEVTVETPQFKNIYLKNINCLEADHAIYIKGLPEMPVRDINFEDIRMAAAKGLTVNYAENIELKNLDLTAKKEHLILTNSKNIKLNNYLFVAADGSGDCDTFAEAVNILEENNVINKVYIKNGCYKEKIVFPESLTDITFIGEDSENTILTYNDYARKIKDNDEEMGTFASASIFINGERLKFRNLSFVNTAKPRNKVGQAVAASIGGDRISFYNCQFKGNQDTLYTKSEGSLFFDDCYLEGDVDFIFGAATAYFNSCEIHSTGPGYITAASTPEAKEYGYIFKNCALSADLKKDSVFLGRPWRPYGSAVFIDCYLGQHIRSEGWNNWRDPEKEKTARYAEYNNYGPGADDRHRSDWIDILTAEEANHYNINKVFTDQSWI